jgi:pantoate kinase
MAGAAVARSPGHISGYFRRIPGATPRETGSAGAGIVIEEGVTARAVPSPVPRVKVLSPASLPAGGRILSRGSPSPPGRSRHSPEGPQSPGTTTARSRGAPIPPGQIRLLRSRRSSEPGLPAGPGIPLIEAAMERLGVSAEVTTESPLPAGAGFGLSAAALLASISALSALFDLDLPGREIATLAHEIEVENRTGLGDVAACQGGGVECRRGPGVGAEIQRIPAPGQVLHAVSLGPIPTPAILGDPVRMARIDRAFPGRCPRDLVDLFGLSRSFAGASGLVTPRVQEILDACDRAGVKASMTMLGEGVFALGEEAAPALAPFGKVYRLRVAERGFSRGEVVR